MQKENCTVVTELLITGFQDLHIFKIPLFSSLLMAYVVTCLEHCLVIVLVITNVHLQTPMYFLISILSSCEILYVTNIVPKMLYDTLSERGATSVLGCITQLNLFGTLGMIESLLFALMAYDRYLAIAKPLRYSALMDNWLCFRLVIGLCLISFISVMIISILLSKIEFCGANIINHFYCDFGPLIALSRSDTTLIQQMAFLLSSLFTLLPFILIFLSYMCILYTILRIRSSVGRQKAFSTCSSHLFAVTIYYATFISIYVVPTGSQYTYINKQISFLYIVVIPLINPIIYTLKNQDIHKALQKKISDVKMFF
ncbi:olfactory receptor 5P68-like [Pseudophryne corroboree]|uniref:olfactory receptor 5P68-like n=1 Tax=Pseudophryne corroboree TaxID=495146 RepID=UPI0030817484